MAGRGEDGFVRHSDASPARYLEIYADVVGPHDPRLDQARQSMKDGLEASQFEQKRTKINSHLDQALSLAATPYQVSSRGKRPHTRYGIELPPERISIG
jgi:hypothetical protein